MKEQFINKKIENNKIFQEILEINGYVPRYISDEYLYYGRDPEHSEYVKISDLDKYFDIDSLIRVYLGYKYSCYNSEIDEIKLKLEENDFTRYERERTITIGLELIEIYNSLDIKGKSNLMYDITGGNLEGYLLHINKDESRKFIKDEIDSTHSTLVRMSIINELLNLNNEQYKCIRQKEVHSSSK